MTIDDLRILVGHECLRLANLGSADAIARELAARGMHGRRKDCLQCPLARGISDTLMIGNGTLNVCRDGISIGPFSDGRWAVRFRENLLILEAFVVMFDRGELPTLIQETL